MARLPGRESAAVGKWSEVQPDSTISMPSAARQTSSIASQVVSCGDVLEGNRRPPTYGAAVAQREVANSPARTEGGSSSPTMRWLWLSAETPPTIRARARA